MWIRRAMQCAFSLHYAGLGWRHTESACEELQGHVRGASSSIIRHIASTELQRFLIQQRMQSLNCFAL